VAQPYIYRRAKMTVFGPAVELDLDHHLGLDPGGRVRQLGLLGERAGVPFERLQRRLQLLQGALVEARPDVRHKVELPLVPVPDEQSAQRRARTLPPRVAADDEVRAHGRLDLQPVRRAPARLVAAVLALADDTLEAALERRLAQGDAVLRRVHQLHSWRRQEAL